MIHGFENETHDLTPKEIELLPLIIAGLSTKIGREMAITNRQMCKGLLEKCGVKIGEPRIRKIIAHLRNTGVIRGLIATSEGYYISRDIEEVKSYIDSLHGRQSAISGIKVQMCKYMLELAAQYTDEPSGFTDAETADIYGWLKDRVPSEHMPAYTPALAAGITYAIHSSFYYNLIAKQHSAFIQAIHDYFISRREFVKADTIRGQVARVMEDFTTLNHSTPSHE